MNDFYNFKRASIPAIGRASLAGVLISIAAVGCGGGGGAPAPVPEAVVVKVDDAVVLEGNTSGGTVDLAFKVTLDKALINKLDATVKTVSLIKTGFTSTPSAAKGGASCNASEVDYIEQASLVIAQGAASGQLVVKVCQDTVFEPNEALEVTLKGSNGITFTARGTIVNDDPGGLNGTGVTSGLLGRQVAFGRDTVSLTNSNADGALGFSMDAATHDKSCVIDKVTGLTWQGTWDATTKFGDAEKLVTAANAARLCRYNDWRLPSINELVSLLDLNIARGNSINADAPLGIASMAGQFWSREQVGASAAATNAWLVDVSEGGLVSFKPKTEAMSVRLVRGSSLDSSCEAGRDSLRFDVLEAPDGTVYDRKTSLTWMRCSEGYAGSSCTKDTAADAFDPSKVSDDYLSTWLQSVNGNAAAKGLGFGDWRIPTVKELASLVDRCGNSPAISGGFFPGTLPGSYMTSTPNANEKSSFWFVNFVDGTVSVGAPTNKSLRLVRGGQ